MITPTNVAHALSLVGAEPVTKKAHFARLAQETDFASDVSDEEDAEPINVSPKGKGKRKATDEQIEEHVHPIIGCTSPHRLVFPPFVRLPGSSPYPATPHSVVPYLPWPPLDTSEASNVECEGDSEIDEDALAKELLEDDDLNEVDQQADATHEKKLWSEFDGTRTTPTELVYEDSEDEGPQRKRRKTVKTAEFVVDSDDEMA